MQTPGAASLPALAAITARADSHPDEYAGERMNVVDQSAKREAATNLTQTDQPFACGTVCRRKPHDRRAYRRISRDGRGLRSSRSATGVPGRKRPLPNISC
jgi:hypothetical protein